MGLGTPGEEVEVYLALRGDGDGDEVIWAEDAGCSVTGVGPRRTGLWEWLSTQRPPLSCRRTFPWVLPPRVARQWHAGDVGRADGSFGGTELALYGCRGGGAGAWACC